MATICQTVINNARHLLRDTDPDLPQHSDSTLLGWLNECYTVMVDFKPSSNIEHQVIQLVPGTDQTIIERFISIARPLVNVISNAQITAVDPDLLDRYQPNWHGMAPAIEVQHILLDENEPTHFSVYPPQPDPAGQIKLAVVAIPMPATELTSVISVREDYVPALTDYICYRALAEDSDNPANREKSELYFNKFAQGLGVKIQTQRAVRPIKEDRI